MGKERKTSYRKMKRSMEERHTQIHRNLFDIFRRSQMSVPIFTMCSNTFTLFWLGKTSVIIKIYQISLCVCVPFLHISLHFLVRAFPSFSHFLCYPYFVLSSPQGLNLFNVVLFDCLCITGSDQDGWFWCHYCIWEWYREASVETQKKGNVQSIIIFLERCILNMWLY